MPDDDENDLWPSEIMVNVLSPLMILRQQAEIISKRTQGIVIGDVRISFIGADLKELCFDVIASAIGHRQRGLTARYPHDVPYPTLLMADVFAQDKFPSPFDESLDQKHWHLQSDAEVARSRIAYSPSQFKGLLREIFNSSGTISILLSLIARSNELASQSLVSSEPVK